MKLAGFDLYRYDLPFTEPVTLKGTVLGSREGLLLRLTAENGSEGWGEAAPLPNFSRETLGKAARQLLGLSRPLLGTEASERLADPAETPTSSQELTELVPSARFALELAVRNLTTPSAGSALTTAEGESSRSQISLSGLISASPQNALEEGYRMARAGYRAVKLKVGGRSVVEDVDLVWSLRGAVGDGVELRLDANRSWAFGEAVEFGRGVAGAGVRYVEEPLSEPRRLAELASLWGLPVALDETLVGAGPRVLGDHEYARFVVLKPTLLGGISRTLSLAEQARRRGMAPVVSSTYESGVGTAGLVALAAVLGDEPAGLDTYRRFAADVIPEPLELSAPSADVRRATSAAWKVDLGRLQPVGGP